MIRFPDGTLIVVMGDTLEEVGRIENLFREHAQAEMLIDAKVEKIPILIDEWTPVTKSMTQFVEQMVRVRQAVDDFPTLNMRLRKSKGERKRNRKDRWR